MQGNLEEGLKRFQELIDQNRRDFRPYICQVSLSASQLRFVHSAYNGVHWLIYATRSEKVG